MSKGQLMPMSISQLLGKIAVSHRNAVEKSFGKIGLHSGQAKVLFSLWCEDGLSQADLTRELGIAAPTVNVLVSKLELDVFVECRNCPGDRRLKRVFLTEKGKEKQNEAEHILESLDDLILADLSDIERNTARLVLNRIHTNLRDGEIRSD